MGGSQMLDASLIRKGQFDSTHNRNLNTSDAAYRVCKFHNVCLLYGSFPTFVYFEDPRERQLPSEYRFSQFTPDHHLQLGILSEFYSTRVNESFMPLKILNQPIPRNAKFIRSDIRVGFLGAHSLVNYGHHLMDVLIATYSAALLYDIPPSRVEQVFDSSCMRFKYFEPHASVDEDHTHHEKCMEYLVGWSSYVFDHEPVFLDDRSKRGARLCYRTLIAGFGSAYSQKAWDLSRQLSIRSFRDHVLERLQKDALIPMPDKYFDSAREDSIILVPLSGSSSYRAANVVNDLNDRICSGVVFALEELQMLDDFTIDCFFPEYFSFAEQVLKAQRAKIIVSYHGTLAYSALFARSGTQAIFISTPEANAFCKDFHIFSRLTYLHVLWLSEHEMDKLPALLEHSIRLLTP